MTCIPCLKQNHPRINPCVCSVNRFYETNYVFYSCVFNSLHNNADTTNGTLLVCGVMPKLGTVTILTIQVDSFTLTSLS